MRPLWFEYPSDARTFAVDTAHLLGPDLFVAPVLDEGHTSVRVYLPGSEPWYDAVRGSLRMPGETTLDAPLDKINVLQVRLFAAGAFPHN